MKFWTPNWFNQVYEWFLNGDISSDEFVEAGVWIGSRSIDLTSFV